MALAFAVFFAAVTSMNDREARESLLENRQHLLRRYSAGLNQALVDGDYLGNPKVTELQALTIFVTCLRAHDTSRAVWVLIGTTIRLAQSIGLHRDGMLLKLCPFETEIRVRLWWHLCLLDSRSPEDHGFELTLDIFNQGPRLPLNVNDNQLYPDMKALPEGSEVWTEMTFFLVQIEAAKILHPVLRTKQDSGTDALGDLMTKRQMIADHVRLIEDRYLSNGNMDIPLHRAAFYHYHTACEKMRFMLQLREELYLQPNKISDNPDHVVRQSFTMAYRVLEDPTTHRQLWRWVLEWLINERNQQHLGLFGGTSHAGSTEKGGYSSGFGGIK
ncbi:hypothetical protein EYZ11_005304 [Aspergillus tanneri]|uniref:Xylanolytic transcriptional activator regulatory domain-containing protein n=1 Tax=Aspergillus tanneri TaxID=1220188 RepID=A0A4S3JKP0_9EURO|nr:hypothetical protein EYZ11_005304 [Aspergillus tanneri]